MRMNNLFSFIGKVLSFLAMFFVLANPVMAGERVPPGTVIAEESYVFTIDETAELMQTIEELEETVQDQEELIELYKELDETNQQQELQLEELLEIRQEQIIAYEDWIVTDAARIKALERQKRFGRLESWGFLVVGILVTGSAIVVADRLDDNIIENN